MNEAQRWSNLSEVMADDNKYATTAASKETELEALTRAFHTLCNHFHVSAEVLLSENMIIVVGEKSDASSPLPRLRRLLAVRL